MTSSALAGLTIVEVPAIGASAQCIARQRSDECGRIAIRHHRVLILARGFKQHARHIAQRTFELARGPHGF